jgi:hypothetical protein
VTSTPDCFAVTGDTPLSDQHNARDRFLALVADARASVQAALVPQPDDGAGRVLSLEPGSREDTSGEGPAARESPSAAQRLEQVVSVLLGGHAVERAEVRVVGDAGARSPDGSAR